MISRVLCGMLAVAMAGPCLAEPTTSARAVSQTLVKQTSQATAAARPQTVVGFTTGKGFKNGYSTGSHVCTWCGPGTQYINRNCSLRLDLSDGIGLWDPCNGCGTCSTCGGCSSCGTCSTCGCR